MANFLEAGIFLFLTGILVIFPGFWVFLMIFPAASRQMSRKIVKIPHRKNVKKNSSIFFCQEKFVNFPASRKCQEKFVNFPASRKCQEKFVNFPATELVLQGKPNSIEKGPEGLSNGL